jgi:hypothetical protein
MIDLIIGIIGMTCILLAFVLEDFGKIKRGGNHYNILNLVGSSFLIYYSITLKSIVFIILNAVWAVVAVYFLIRKK